MKTMYVVNDETTGEASLRAWLVRQSVAPVIHKSHHIRLENGDEARYICPDRSGRDCRGQLADKVAVHMDVLCRRDYNRSLEISIVMMVRHDGLVDVYREGEFKVYEHRLGSEHPWSGVSVGGRFWDRALTAEEIAHGMKTGEWPDK